ncbi:hypothetical protein R1sor_003587 [Riccia sorocarpa]|uniref:PGG domain-containing protein n=1 Tax=Riccia sorocarpa TaxID=122646 RepID=A0ABD3H5H1_9MARC
MQQEDTEELPLQEEKVEASDDEDGDDEDDEVGFYPMEEEPYDISDKVGSDPPGDYSPGDPYSTTDYPPGDYPPGNPYSTTDYPPGDYPPGNPYSTLHPAGNLYSTTYDYPRASDPNFPTGWEKPVHDGAGVSFMEEDIYDYSQGLEMPPLIPAPRRFNTTKRRVATIEEEWVRALDDEDGFSLMRYLEREPSLASIRSSTRGNINVLHLAVRKEWYGLVLLITEMFAPTAGTLPHLHPDVLRDLLTEKEGKVGCRTKDWYSSGLDVLAMVTIQRHNAINTQLARAVRCCKLFDDGHPYMKIITALPGLETISKPVQFLTQGEREELQGKEVLTRIQETIFPDLLTWFGLRHAPNMVRGLSSLEDLELDRLGKLGPVVESWMLTRPFLPLSEHLVLEYCRYPEKWELWADDSSTLRFQDDLLRALEETAFIKYFLAITDTRRSLLHYAFLRNRRFNDRGFGFLRNRWHDILHPTRQINRSGASTSLSSEPDFIPTLEFFFRSNDSSGRIPFEVYLASCSDNESDDDPQNSVDVETLEIFRFFNPFDSIITKHDEGSDFKWTYRGLDCSLDVGPVHMVNGYYNSSGSRHRERSVADFVVSSPQHGPWSRMEMLSFLFDFPDFLPQGSCRRPLLRAPDYDQVDEDNPLTPLQHAVLVGDTAMVRLLVKSNVLNSVNVQDNRAWDPARFKNHNVMSNRFNSEEHSLTSALQLAAAQGSPEMIRILLDSGAFDACYRNNDGDTALHAAARSSGPCLLPVMLTDFVEIPGGKNCPEVGNFHGPEGLQMIELSLARDRLKGQESTYQGCLNMLLQAGIDIWQRNNANEVPFLHQEASPEYRLWWFEKLDRETQEQTAKLTTAANALSVTAALVATASYIGPLQPPLGYGSGGNDLVDTVQADFLSVRVFIVCNTLSFYIALVAIMLSLTPSLPMPQESMLDEMKRIRRSVTLGLVSLIMAIVTLLMAFAAASIAVFPESWNRKGLSTGTLVVGSFMCSIVLALCWIRAVRLMFHKSHRMCPVLKLNGLKFQWFAEGDSEFLAANLRGSAEIR